MRCHTSHLRLFLRISTAHIDTAFSIAYNRIRYISIFMYDMLKFPISALVVFALNAKTLSFHLQRLSSSSARGFFSFFFCCCKTLRFILQRQVLQHKMLISTHVFFCDFILFQFGFVVVIRQMKQQPCDLFFLFAIDSLHWQLPH